MNPLLYQKYISLKEEGKRQEAHETIQSFIASFESLAEKQEWVRDFLSRHDVRQRMSYEIYSQLVFPILLDGYKQEDMWSMLWIAKTIQNVYKVDALHAAISYKSESTLLKEIYARQPSPEVNRLLLKANIKWFEYSQHECPRGILYGADGATPEECEEILQEIAFSRSLDTEKNFAVFLNDYEQKLREYQNRRRTSH